MCTHLLLYLDFGYVCLFVAVCTMYMYLHNVISFFGLATHRTHASKHHMREKNLTANAKRRSKKNFCENKLETSRKTQFKKEAANGRKKDKHYNNKMAWRSLWYGLVFVLVVLSSSHRSVHIHLVCVSVGCVVVGYTFCSDMHSAQQISSYRFW